MCNIEIRRMDGQTFIWRCEDAIKKMFNTDNDMTDNDADNNITYDDSGNDNNINNDINDDNDNWTAVTRTHTHTHAHAHTHTQ